MGARYCPCGWNRTNPDGPHDHDKRVDDMREAVTMLRLAESIFEAQAAERGEV